MTKKIVFLLVLFKLALFGNENYVFNSLEYDFNKDGKKDFAIIESIDNPEEDYKVEFKVFLSSEYGLYKKAFSVKNLISGENATMKINSRGSILLSEGHYGGGHSTGKTYTIAYRYPEFSDKKNPDSRDFYVVGFTYDYFNRYSDEDSLNCDFNFFNQKAIIRKGLANSRKIKTSQRRVPLKNWKENTVLKECEN
jgi:hypothetical protein